MSVLVSVIMPTYNCEKYIEESIKSVISQTVSDWEIQIVDDGSTDNTYKVIEPFLKDYSNIHYHRLPDNAGTAKARTEAIKRATGKYCAFLDADDLWLPNKLEKQISFMEKTGALFSCTGYSLIDANGGALYVAKIPPRITTYDKCIRLSDPIGNLTAIYNQEVLGKLSVPDIRRRNDFALWLKVLKKTEACYGMEEVLGIYRKGREGSISRNKWKLLKYHWILFHKIEKHSIIRSAFEIGCWVVVKGTGLGIKKIKLEKTNI